MVTTLPHQNKSGRPKIGVKCTIVLPPYLLEWAVAQPGGFSALARRLLLEEYQHQEQLRQDCAAYGELPF